MCECIKRIETSIKENCQKDYKKRITDVRCSGAFISLSNGRTQMTSTFKISLEGQKKEELVNLQHHYCPFCGEKY